MKVFNREDNKGFERTYGWAWFLKLHKELKLSDQDNEHGWSTSLQFLAEKMVQNYKDFLPSLVYAMRVGEHPNTAFGLIFAYEYAIGQSSSDTFQNYLPNVKKNVLKEFFCKSIRNS